MSRFAINMTEQERKELKARAAMEGKTIHRYARERLFQPEIIEITDELRGDLQARLDEALAAPEGSFKSFDEIVEAALTEAAK